MSARTLTSPRPRSASRRAVTRLPAAVLVRTKLDTRGWHQTCPQRRTEVHRVEYDDIDVAHVGFLSGVMSEDPTPAQRKADTTVLCPAQAWLAGIYEARRG